MRQATEVCCTSLEMEGVRKNMNGEIGVDPPKIYGHRIANLSAAPEKTRRFFAGSRGRSRSGALARASAPCAIQRAQIRTNKRWLIGVT